MSPGLGLYRFAGGLALGGGVGLLYGLLRPVRRVWLRDLLFALGLGAAWTELAFRVCRGDIRLWYLAALYLGAAAWERVFGAALVPVISGFWKFFGVAGMPIKIFLEFLKKNFATGEKWDIIRRVEPGRRGAARHGGQSIPPKQSKIPGGISQ